MSDEELHRKTEWMKHNLEPESCRQYMLETASARYTFIRGQDEDGEKRSVNSILEQYPRLLDPGNVSFCIDINN